MKVHLANYQPDRLGGGWSFQSNFAKGFDLVSYEEADTYFIAGPTMASHEEADKAKRDGKKIVFRVDNAVRHSRNRGTGMPRMEHFAQVADLVIYQSEWAKGFLKPFLKKDGVVILNGVDTKVFNINNKADIERQDSYLYVRSSRDEGKQWIAAWYWFVNNPGHLEIVGKFSGENIEYGFDFFNGERFTFTGEVRDMPAIYKRNRYFLYSYLCEAGSNTLLEARASGCEIIDVFGMLQTGCGPEYMALEDLSLERMHSEYKEAISGI